MSNESKKVVCRDIYGNTYEVAADQLTFRPSVYGIIVRDNKILLAREWDGYDLPGGGIKLGETIEEALMREVQEETGYTCTVGKLVACRNSFFKKVIKDEFIHSTLLYYTCDVNGGTASTQRFSESEKTYMSAPEWIALDDISKIRFYSSVDLVNIITSATR